ncbi:spore germination protein YaaH [Paenibacillus castaneae]|uniref:glycosyl hydrolase family 18 protein n=1 Tax=Paenibacillus castaneae TaxID=474957 RepID=UPI00141B3EC9|nr:S-layer homology domain-containing protein [Paenibacillus castaneae]NIK75813.1 spore germination protein YaaH [Paenibacillus castaneae]
MKSIIIRVAAASIAGMCMISQLAQPVSAQISSPFQDISSSYAKDDILALYEKNILTGTSNTIFSPIKSMTRAEFVTVLDRLLGLEPVASPVTSFKDIAPKDWYYGWIQAAVQLGLVGGTSASTFAPSSVITRQEAAVLLTRAMKQMNEGNGIKLSFNDKSLISDWAVSSVAAMQKIGLMKGDETGRFRPRDPIQRQEIAVLINRVLHKESWAAELERKAENRIQLGWQYGQTTDEYRKSIVNSNVNTLSPRWYFLDEAGAVSNGTVPSLVTWAHTYNRKVWAMVGNRSNQEETHRVLSSADSRNKLINTLTSYVKQYGLDGLDIDFENMAPKDRSVFTTFITDLRAKLHAINAVLVVNVSADEGTDWTDVFDYAALGKQADYVLMMGYDEHWSGDTVAGSVASLPFVKDAMDNLLKVVPNKKIILALPLYNRDWSMNKNGSSSSSVNITLAEQNRLIAANSIKPVWNSVLGQYTASYTKSGVQHRLWLEEGRSLSAKYELALNDRIAGLAYWHIGGESSDTWTSLRNADKYAGYSF